jgi:hypothetical protein
MKPILLFFIMIGLSASHIQCMDVEEFKAPEKTAHDEALNNREVDEYIQSTGRRAANADLQPRATTSTPQEADESSPRATASTPTQDSGISINLTDAQTKVQAITDRLHHLPEADQQKVLQTLADFNKAPRSAQDVQILIQTLEQNPSVKAILEGTNNGQGRTWMQLFTDPTKRTQLFKDLTLGLGKFDDGGHGINTLNTIFDLSRTRSSAPSTQFLTSNDLARYSPDSLGVKDGKPSQTISTSPAQEPITDAAPENIRSAAQTEISAETEPIIDRTPSSVIPDTTSSSTKSKSTKVQITELRKLIASEGDSQKAAQAYEKIAELSSKAIDKRAALQQAAQIYENIKSYFDAGTLYSKIADSIQSGAQKISLYTQAGDMYNQDKSTSGKTMAQQMYEQALKIAQADPTTPVEALQPLYTKLADVYTKTGSYTKAAQAYTQAANIAAADPQAQIDLLTKAQNAYEASGNSMQVETMQNRIEMLREMLPPTAEPTIVARASSAASSAASSISSGLSRAGSATQDIISKTKTALTPQQQYNPDNDDLLTIR